MSEMFDDKAEQQAALDLLNAALAGCIKRGFDIGVVLQFPNRRESVVQPRSTAWATVAFRRAAEAADARLAVITADGIERVRIEAQSHVAADHAERAEKEAAK